MSAFEYSALDQKGREKKGILEGDSARLIRQQLREKNLVPLTVAEVKNQSGNKKNNIFVLNQRINTTELALMTRQLATLSRSGIPLDEATATVARQSIKPKIKKLLLGVRAKILEGHTLADGLRDYPHIFSEMYCATVAAGEQSGHLDVVLERLADYTEQRQQIQQRMKLALIYPVILTIMSILVVSGLLTYVVPEVVKVFSDTGQKLPWLTIALIAVSDFMQVWFIYLFLAMLAAFVIFKKIIQKPVFRKRYHQLVLKLPVIGNLALGANSAQFSRTLSILAASGVPILEAMRIAVKVMDNIPMREAVENASQQVSEGSSLSNTLEQSGYFNPMLINLIASGEATGQLEQMLERAAMNQERELETTLAMLMGLLEPLLIVVMGGVVLIIVLAILLPVLDLNQLVK
ncbi:MAG: type II secretion system inner membrane protein GspF [Gammaproteobacteria bacterium]|nr:type II secretion system inner membrane protein GspF [Gammaproteobacteria bacterium]MCW8988873.1 type II secretion system inner membrane protein GspF [Gammaproteobacteria bacterium]MCW9029902.1 type II secretion system inner membrane protein GspF [Gammaproteobacteria bacterium]